VVHVQQGVQGSAVVQRSDEAAVRGHGGPAALPDLGEARVEVLPVDDLDRGSAYRLERRMVLALRVGAYEQDLGVQAIRVAVEPEPKMPLGFDTDGAGLLTGAAGVALTLLTATGDSPGPAARPFLVA
jgi:hypothetical protein